MDLRLSREPSTPSGTYGALYLNGVWQCWTLEDIVRDVKIPRETAIPAGVYPVTLTPSVRFKRILPLVNTVPGFTGVRIHPGNTIEDTEGCILVGQDRDMGRVLKSRIAFERLFEKLSHATTPITLTIVPSSH